MQTLFNNININLHNAELWREKRVSPTLHLNTFKTLYLVKMYLFTKYTTISYSLPLFSSILKKEGRRNKERNSKTSF